jgi:hypothetical protein
MTSGDTSNVANQFQVPVGSNVCRHRYMTAGAASVAASVARVVSRNSLSDAIPISTGNTNRTMNARMTEYPARREGCPVATHATVKIFCNWSGRDAMRPLRSAAIYAASADSSFARVRNVIE